MAKIIVYGDIDISPLYISVDRGKEVVVSGKWARCFNVSDGTHLIYATTVTKLQRATATPSVDALSSINNFITNESNTTLEGTIDLDNDEVLLIQVKQGVLKTNVYNKVVKASEVNAYIDMNMVFNYGERAPGEKNKWVVFFLCLFLGVFGVHRFYEKKIITGIIYLLTLGLCGFGVIYDLFMIIRR